MAGMENGEDLRVVQVAAGEAHTLALTASGSLYTWGRGLFGRLGIGVSQDEHVPSIVEIGACGDEDDDSQSSYSDVSNRDDGRSGPLLRDRDGAAQRLKIVQVAAGSYHSLALAGDGTVWSWGYNACQLGHEKSASFPAPIKFSSVKTSVQDDGRRGGKFWSQAGRDGDDKHPKIMLVEAGGMISCAVDQEGGLWLWGAVPPPSTELQDPESRSYNKGNFSITNIEKPERVLSFLAFKVTRVACGNEHILALVEGRNSSECYAWGSNSSGQLGLGDLEPRAVPTLISSLIGSHVGTIIDFACGAFHSAIVTLKDDEPSDLVLEPAQSPMQRKMQPSPQLMAQMMGSPKPMMMGSPKPMMMGSPKPMMMGLSNPKLMGSPTQRGRPMPEQYIEAMSSPKMRPRQGGYPGYPYPGQNNSNSNGYIPYHESPKLGSRSSSQSSLSSLGGWGSRIATTTGRKESSGLDARISICWTFGQGENGQLGQGSTANLVTPAPVEGLPVLERLRTVVCGLYHTGVVTETGDVWVWGMEGGLGLCPGIGPPGSRSVDTLIPVRVFGESSAKCHPVTGSKGIACGAAHTVTVSNGGRDLWAWGHGQSGVLGLGHASDSWFPCRVIWPPGSSFSSTTGANNLQHQHQQADMETMYEMRKSSRGSSRAGSKGRGDDVRPYLRDLEDSSRPPRSESSSRKPFDFTKSSRRGDDFRPPMMQRDSEDPRLFRRETGMDTASTSMSKSASYDNSGPMQSEDVHASKVELAQCYDTFGAMQSGDMNTLKAELAECRRYAESLHSAIFGGLETFSYNQSQESIYGEVGGGAPSSEHGYNNGLPAKSNTPLEDLYRRIEMAPDEELVQLDHFYKGMRNRLKDMLFQRKMEDWCRRCMSTLSSSSFQEPPPMREPFSLPSTPSIDGPREFAMRMSGIMSDRGEMLPPAAIAASIAEFRMLSQRRR